MVLSGRNVTSAQNQRQHFWGAFSFLTFLGDTVNNHGRSTRGAFADGDVARFPYHLRGDRYRDARADGDRRMEMAAHERRRLSDVGPTLGQGYGDTLRRRRRFGNSAFV